MSKSDLRYTTFVLRKETTPFDYDIPILLISGGAWEQYPVPSSIHRIEHEVMIVERGGAQFGPLPVDDEWISAVENDYDHKAKIVLVPGDVDHDDVTVEDGFPRWVKHVFDFTTPSYRRDCIVSSGTDPLSIMIDMESPRSLRGWEYSGTSGGRGQANS